MITCSETNMHLILSSLEAFCNVIWLEVSENLLLQLSTTSFDYVASIILIGYWIGVIQLVCRSW